MSVETIRLADVSADERLQTRASGLDEAVIGEYAAAFKAGEKMPPGVVYRDAAGVNWLSQGFHRQAGARLAGLVELPYEVRAGEFADAKLDAAASNKTHGLRRTNEDKRRAVRFVLEIRPDWTDSRIAEHVGVSLNFVTDIRAEVAATDSPDEPEGEISSDDISSPNDTEGGRRGPKRKKPNHAIAIARLLRQDHERADDDVAREVGCGKKLVERIRRALVEKGQIPRVEAPARTRAEVEAERKAKEVHEAARLDARRFGPFADRLAAGEPVADVHKDFVKERNRPTQKKHALKDGRNVDVPDRLRDLFGNPWYEQFAEEVAEILTRVAKLKRDVAAQGRLLKEWLPLERCEEFAGLALTNLRYLASQVASNKPHAVCPECGGDGCKAHGSACHKAGWLPKYRADELKAEGRL